MDTTLESLGGTENEALTKVTGFQNLPDSTLPIVNEIQQIGASSQEIQKLAKSDLDFLAALTL